MSGIIYKLVKIMKKDIPKLAGNVWEGCKAIPQDVLEVEVSYYDKVSRRKNQVIEVA